MSTMTKDLYAVAETPPLGHVPPKMHTMAIRREHFGEPKTAFRPEVVETPMPGPREVLVYVMAAGINYNNVWAARGVPVDVIKARNKAGEAEDFHIGGSDASGIVYAVGEGVTNVRVGDEVVVHCGMWDREDPWIKGGGDPIVAPSNDRSSNGSAITSASTNVVPFDTSGLRPKSRTARSRAFSSIGSQKSTPVTCRVESVRSR